MDGSFDPEKGFELEPQSDVGISEDLDIGPETGFSVDTAIPKDKYIGRDNMPDWGKVKPLDQFEYTDRDGNTIFWVGRYVIPGSNAEELRPIYYDGKTWVKKVNPLLKESLPLYNLMDIYALGVDGKYNSNTIVVVQDEKVAESLNEMIVEYQLPLIATTWFGGVKALDAVELSPLENKRVIIWMNHSKDSEDMGMKFLALASTHVSSATIVTNAYDSPHNFGPYDFCKANNLRDLMATMESGTDVVLDQPEVILNKHGISNLEGKLPINTIRDMTKKYGTLDRDGRRRLKSDYITVMNVIEDDPAFKQVCKFDEAVSDLIWDREAYPTIDDLKNGFLRRLAKYGIVINKQIREDVILSMSSDPRRRVNTFIDFFENLATEYPDVDETSLDDFMKLIDVGETEAGKDDFGPNKEMYKKAMHMFFTKSALRIYTHNLPSPVPNDCCPVFVGGQGVGKSRLCRYISMEPSKFFIDLGNKSAPFGSENWIRLISGKLIGELGEMSVYKKVDVETVKSGISEIVDTYIPKFKEGAKEVPRLTNFLGTSNESDFLKDMTGNRRFFPINIVKVSEALLGNHEIIRKIWSYYYQMARAVMNPEYNPEGHVPPAMVVVPDDVQAYYAKTREQSMDIGLLGDLIKEAILKIEVKDYYERKGPNVFQISMSVVEIANNVYDYEPEKATFDFKKKAKYILGTLGYYPNVFSKDSRTLRGFSIDRDNTQLLIRVGDDDRRLELTEVASMPKNPEMKVQKIRTDIY